MAADLACAVCSVIAAAITRTTTAAVALLAVMWGAGHCGLHTSTQALYTPQPLFSDVTNCCYMLNSRIPGNFLQKVIVCILYPY